MRGRHQTQLALVSGGPCEGDGRAECLQAPGGASACSCPQCPPKWEWLCKCAS